MQILVRPFLAAFGMGVVVFICYHGIMRFFAHNTIVTLFSVIVGVAAYAVLIIKLKIVTEETLANMPKGGMLVRMAKKVHLL
jgi:stage V sporulation protein B